MTDEKGSGAGSAGPGKDGGARRDDDGLSMASFGGLGLQFAISILLFLYIGHWVDGKLGTDPLFLIVGVFTGAGASFYSMYRKLAAGSGKGEAGRSEKDEKGQRDEKGGKGV